VLLCVRIAKNEHVACAWNTCSVVLRCECTAKRHCFHCTQLDVLIVLFECMSATAALEERMTRRVVRGHVNKRKYKYKRYYVSLKSVTQADATSCRRGIETHPFGAENWQVVPRDLGAQYTVCSTADGRRCFLLARTLIQTPSSS
jgi:hypothetical protein